MIEFVTLASGSKANSVYVEVDGVAILLDCGLSKKELTTLLRQINKKPIDISCALISHLHSDHYNAKTLEKCGISVRTMFQHNKSEKIWNAKITPFSLSHDVDCYGFRVEDKKGNILVYAVDTGDIPYDSMPFFFDANAIILEANYDILLLAGCEYQQPLKNRVRDNHLSNNQFSNLVDIVKWPGLKFVTAAHVSSKSNTTEWVDVYCHKPGIIFDIAEQAHVGKMRMLF